MVSSPFGGVDGVNRGLLLDVFERLGIDLGGKKVLDVGCGRAYTGDVVAELGGDYTGSDFVVSRAGIRLAQADAAALPFADATFDAVFCIDAYEHIPDPDVAAAEFRRVLKPGGFFLLSAPNYGNVAGIVKKVYEGLGWYEKNTWAPFGRWQPQEWETALTGPMIKGIFKRAGFERIHRIGHDVEVGPGLFPWVDHPKMPESIQFRLQRLFRFVGGPVVALCRGASWVTKRWPEESWLALGRALEEKGCRVIVLGQEGEGIDVGTDFSGRTGVREAACLLHQADLTISSDSGLMHLSLAAGTKTIGLFGPTDSAILIADDDRFTPITNERECQGCWNHDLSNEEPGRCPKDIVGCMDVIEAARVLDVALGKLGESR